MKRFQTVPPRPTAADVPLSRLDADLKAIVARQRACQVLADAAASAKSPSDQLAYALDAWLVTHPDAPVSTNDSYPGWAEHVAALEADNHICPTALEAS